MPQLIYEIKKSSKSGKYYLELWNQILERPETIFKCPGPESRSGDVWDEKVTKVLQCVLCINWAELAGDGRLLAVTPWRAPGYEDNY